MKEISKVLNAVRSHCETYEYNPEYVGRMMAVIYEVLIEHEEPIGK